MEIFLISTVITRRVIMSNLQRSKLGVRNGIFGAAVVVLIIVAAVGFGLYGTANSKTITSLNTVTVTTTNVSTAIMTSETMMTSSEMMNHSTTGMMGNTSN